MSILRGSRYILFSILVFETRGGAGSVGDGKGALITMMWLIGYLADKRHCLKEPTTDQRNRQVSQMAGHRILYATDTPYHPSFLLRIA